MTLWLVVGLALLNVSIADMAYPPPFEQRKKRVTPDLKPVITFDWYQAVTATVFIVLGFLVLFCFF